MHSCLLSASLGRLKNLWRPTKIHNTKEVLVITTSIWECGGTTRCQKISITIASIHFQIQISKSRIKNVWNHLCIVQAIQIWECATANSCSIARDRQCWERNVKRSIREKRSIVCMSSGGSKAAARKGKRTLGTCTPRGSPRTTTTATCVKRIKLLSLISSCRSIADSEVLKFEVFKGRCRS